MIRLALAVLLLSIGSASIAASLSEAQEAYENNKVADSERMFVAIASNPGASADDRAGANIALARIAWLIDGNADLALQRLDAARATGKEPCDAGIMRSRVLREAKRSAEAIGAEDSLLHACPESDKRDAIRINVIAAMLDLAQSDPARRKQMLVRARSEALLLTPDAGVEGARQRLEIALLSDSAAGALGAWKDYFWVDEGDAPQALEHLGAARLFTRGLAANSTVNDRLALADLLMRAGFSQQSRRYAEAHGLPGSTRNSPTWRKLQAYWSERDKLEAEVLRVNRELARGRKDDEALDRAAKSATMNLMAAVGATGDPRAALLKYYGLVGTVGLTNGYPSIHMGHVIEDRDEQVTQYGHAARIRFVAIDNMVSNGFTSWLWDGSAMVGGWQSNGVIIQVRPGYVQGPLNAYLLTQDSVARKRLIERQPRKAAEDIARLRVRPVATLEGLNDRLLLQTVDQVDAAVRSRTPPEGDIRKAFLAEYSRATFNHSIRVHEGRHAIDAALGLRLDQPVLEYRAKLSELALTAYPRMALMNIDRSLEGSGPHDIAGARIFDGYRKWMEAHPAEIMGYDPAVPVLEQLDKLTDAQIREIARSLDPLAQGQSAIVSSDSPSGTSRR